jgi:acetyl-CoA acyltransferase
MRQAVLLDSCRSPIGKGSAEKGLFRNLRAEDLAVQVLRALLARLPVDPQRIDDFFLGCVGQHLEQGKNLARLVLLLAGLPRSIPGATLNRLCASSLTALQFAADGIRSGSHDLVLVGGVEHMGHVPMTAALDYHPRLFEGAGFRWTHMGLTAELLAERFAISREDQDGYALESHRRHFQALEAGSFQEEIVPITLADGARADRDEGPRLSTIEKLAQLPTPFKEDGTVTAGNSSGIADGACMALVCSDATARDLGREPLARIVATANVGVDPETMGLGPVPAIQRLLLEDIDLFEINEAFAVQVLACQRQLGIPLERLNVRGGAVALGHPLGMSGLRIAASLARTLRQRGMRRGIAALCVGHGQGVAALLER